MTHPPRFWTTIEVILALILMLLALMQTGQMMGAMISTSLSTDEFGTVGTFSSKGPIRVITDYRAPKNHVFFNLANSILPGRESLDPSRARFLSVLATSTIAIALILAALTLHRWLECGIIMALWASAPKMLELSMEARGYGFLALFALIASIAAFRYLDSLERPWLVILSVATVLGGYTVPAFIFFGAPLLILTWAASRRQEAFFAGLIAAGVTLLLYSPILFQLVAAYRDFQSEAENDFVHWSGVVRAFKLYLYSASDGAATIFLAVLALSPFAAALIRRTPATRGLAVISGAILIAFGVFLVLQSPPVRTSAFLLLPLAFAGVFAIGILLRELPVLPLRVLAVASVCVILIPRNASALRALHFTPAEDWTRTAKWIDAAFPPDAQIEFTRYAKYLKHVLADPARRTAEFDEATFTNGALMVADAGNKWAEGSRFQRPTDESRLAQVTVPGSIRDIVLTFRIPENVARPDVPEALRDADTATGVPPAEFAVEATAGHALVILLDRPVRPRLVIPNVIDATTGEPRPKPEPVLAGNAIAIPLGDAPVSVTLQVHDPDARVTETWITPADEVSSTPPDTPAQP